MTAARRADPSAGDRPQHGVHQGVEVAVGIIAQGFRDRTERAEQRRRQRSPGPAAQIGRADTRPGQQRLGNADDQIAQHGRLARARVAEQHQPGARRRLRFYRQLRLVPLSADGLVCLLATPRRARQRLLQASPDLRQRAQRCVAGDRMPGGGDRRQAIEFRYRETKLVRWEPAGVCGGNRLRKRVRGQRKPLTWQMRIGCQRSIDRPERQRRRLGSLVAALLLPQQATEGQRAVALAEGVEIGAQQVGGGV
ncbi:MAG: hypothetical protein MI924_30195 [Chloroflexales bacterium]|nr:hypothetical protein [Chloroflexales bacterium]